MSTHSPHIMIKYINEVYKSEVNRMHQLCAEHISLRD